MSLSTHMQVDVGVKRTHASARNAMALRGHKACCSCGVEDFCYRVDEGRTLRVRVHFVLEIVVRRVDPCVGFLSSLAQLATPGGQHGHRGSDSARADSHGTRRRKQSIHGQKCRRSPQASLPHSSANGSDFPPHARMARSSCRRWMEGPSRSSPNLFNCDAFRVHVLTRRNRSFCEACSGLTVLFCGELKLAQPLSLCYWV